MLCSLNPEPAACLADQYDAFLFDCDGVLWRGGKLLDGSDTALAMLRLVK